ncbi:metal-dependent hydrolase [Vibrio sp. 10N.261.55.A7]|uniref:metal-dependent hydrolase n=1 Tax=Vibrio sp. 10N.261.55.A7 TaxID=1880851 RepID=UPI000C8490ED|nr:metal-dependent hydrolase [Vibrio sp. 10N.261.55.A7]PMJ95511.1 metal-dependent hydrolase [Vibrio sp. 10N.261.55.A7]
MTVTPTITKFCHQTWQLDSVVQLIEKNNNQLNVVTRETPFHPVSHIWPDHPADKGQITVCGRTLDVDSCLVGAVEVSTNTLYVGSEIPVKRDADGWAFVVVHCIKDCNLEINVGDCIRLEVDKDYQQALSRGHSAGHLAYLALNKILTESYWRKDADRKDPHGNYDFNSYAQVTSFVTEDTCHDVYRLGKTLRKRGLNSAQMIEDLVLIAERVNQQLEYWIQSNAVVMMSCEGEFLTSSRYWSCDLGEGAKATIPCGGTHITSLEEFHTLKVTLIQLDEQNIEMQTDVNKHN